MAQIAFLGEEDRLAVQGGSGRRNEGDGQTQGQSRKK
jgi:hypothetical protein